MSDDAWPGPGDDILAESGDWNAVARVAHGDDGAYLRPDGFGRAAALLVEHALADGHQDSLAYPIGFLYRHAAELYIKRLIALGSRLSGRSVPAKLTHRLTELWSVCRPLLETAEPNAAEYDHVERVLSQLEKLDPNGEAFRYHETTRRSPTLMDVRRLDLSRFRSAMDAMLAFFDACDAALSQDLEDVADMAVCEQEVMGQALHEQEVDMQEMLHDLYDEPWPDADDGEPW